MYTVIQKWGNSLALRIPRSLAKDVHLNQGSSVDLTVIEGKIVLTAKTSPQHTLSQLIKGITKKNIHPKMNWGKPAGKEAW